MRNRLRRQLSLFAGALVLTAAGTTARADQPCIADLDGDAEVGLLDLLLVLSTWGQEGVVADIVPPPGVAVEDLIEILAAWGPCPPSGNDECADSFEAVDGSNAVSIKAASSSTPDPQCTSAAGDVWYDYTPAADGTATILATVDAFMEIYAGDVCPPVGVPICAFAIDGVHELPVIGGETLKIRLVNVFDLPEGPLLEGELFVAFAAVKAPACAIAITATPAAWLPEGRAATAAVDSPGNSISFTATITGGETRKIRFFLEDASDEPGVCMNHGDESDTAKDLKFIQTGTVNPATVFDAPAADGLTITTKEKVASATVTVTCYDWGAFGRIRACCLKADNSDCETSAGAQRIPVDADGNNVADGAPQNTGPGTNKDPKDDKDNSPAGDAADGDNLSRYQEYRGFMVNGGHVRTDVTKKDVFIRNSVGNVGGASLGPSGDFTTDLLTAPVHAIAASEIDGSNRVNFKKSSHHIDLQKAVIATNGNGTDSCTGAAWGETAAPSGARFVPNNIVHCRVCVSLIEGNMNAIAAPVGANGFPAGFTAYLPLEETPPAVPMPRRTRIDNEVIQFTGSSHVGDVLRGNHAAAAGVLQLNATSLFPGSGLVRIENELIIYSGRVQHATTLTEALTHDAAVIKVASTADFAIAGSVSVGDEVILYTGKTATTFTGLTRAANGSEGLNEGESWPVNSAVRYAVLTGLTRGAFGSTAAGHNHDREVLQRVVTGLTRGVDGTTPATHSGGAALKNFADANDKAKQTLGHEAGHSVALIHLVGIKTIMEDGVPPAAFPNFGYWHVYINAAAGTNSIQGKFRVKP